MTNAEANTEAPITAQETPSDASEYIPRSEEEKAEIAHKLLAGEPDPFENQGYTDMSPPHDAEAEARAQLGIDSEEPTQEAEEPEEPVDKPIEIDYDMEIPLSDGREPMKLGEMKDKLTEYQRSEDRMIERENRIFREQQELSDTMSQLGEVPEQLREKATVQREQHLKQQYDLMVDYIPEMGTREGFERISSGIRNELSEAGFSQQEIANISSANVIRYIWNNIRLKQSIGEAKETAKKVKESPVRKPRQSPGYQGRKPNMEKMFEKARAGDETAKAAYADYLLRNGGNP